MNIQRKARVVMRGMLLLPLFWLSGGAWSDVRLTIFDCGEIRFSDIAAFGLANSDTDVRKMFVRRYLFYFDHIMALAEALQLTPALHD